MGTADLSKTKLLQNSLIEYVNRVECKERVELQIFTTACSFTVSFTWKIWSFLTGNEKKTIICVSTVFQYPIVSEARPVHNNKEAALVLGIGEITVAQMVVEYTYIIAVKIKNSQSRKA